MRNFLTSLLFLFLSISLFSQSFGLEKKDTSYVLKTTDISRNGRKVVTTELSMDKPQAVGVIYGQYELLYRSIVQDEFSIRRKTKELRDLKVIIRDTLGSNEIDISNYKYKNLLLGEYRLRIDTQIYRAEIDTNSNGVIILDVPDLTVGDHGTISNKIRMNTLHQSRVSLRNAFSETVELTSVFFYEWEELEDSEEDDYFSAEGALRFIDG